MFLGVEILDPWNTVFAANDVLEGLGSVLSLIIKLFTGIALLMIQLGGELLGTDLITGKEPMTAILPLWRFIRNVTYVGFVLIILFLAFANLFASFMGEAGGGWTIKEKLPKIIIAMIAINFSLLGFRVIIDLVNVGTVSLLAISDTAISARQADTVADMLHRETDENGGDCPPGDNCKSFKDWINENLCPGGKPESKRALVCITEEKLDPNLTSTKKNIFLAFAVYFQSLEKLPALAAGLKDFSNVALSTLFSLVLACAYIVALLAVFIALLSRLVVLWAGMIFSPLIVAAGVMGIGDAGRVSEDLITHLIMPLKIAGAFAVSFVMISAMIEVKPPDVVFVKLGGAFNQFADDNVYGILWKVATVVVFWEVAFWAVKGSFAEFITERIKSGAEQLGKFVASAATIDREIFPLPGKKGFTTFRALGNLPGAIESRAAEDRRQDMAELRKAIPFLNSPGVAESEALANTAAFSNLRQTGYTSGKTAEQLMKEAFKGFEAKGFANMSESGTRNVMELLYEKMGQDISAYERATTNAERQTALLTAAGASGSGISSTLVASLRGLNANGTTTPNTNTNNNSINPVTINITPTGGSNSTLYDLEPTAVGMEKLKSDAASTTPSTDRIKARSAISAIHASSAHRQSILDALRANNATDINGTTITSTDDIITFLPLSPTT